jgi:hypothetical protein
LVLLSKLLAAELQVLLVQAVLRPLPPSPTMLGVRPVIEILVIPTISSVLSDVGATALPLHLPAALPPLRRK